MEHYAPSLTVACPAHRGQDHVRRVSVVYAEAGPALSPARLLISADRLAWAGTVCGVLGAVLIWIRAALDGGAASGALFVVAIVCFGYAVACYGLAAARRAGAFLLRRKPDEEPTVWYCERCNVVFAEKTG